MPLSAEPEARRVHRLAICDALVQVGDDQAEALVGSVELRVEGAVIVEAPAVPRVPPPLSAGRGQAAAESVLAGLLPLLADPVGFEFGEFERHSLLEAAECRAGVGGLCGGFEAASGVFEAGKVHGVAVAA
ncbi:hypothetical protein ABZT16_46025, partial [Streptomyces flaveolus]|uniref:hypothetical protein n=1 Tax=Streptomyces flaveolus TaxID=67297 RepID=UPI0033B3E568